MFGCYRYKYNGINWRNSMVFLNVDIELLHDCCSNLFMCWASTIEIDLRVERAFILSIDERCTRFTFHRRLVCCLSSLILKGMFRIETLRYLTVVNLTIAVLFCSTSIYSYQSAFTVRKISAIQKYQISTLKLTAEKNEGTTVDLKDRLFLYNTLSKDKQLFKSVDINKKKVSFYR